MQRYALLNPPVDTSVTLLNWNISLITASAFLLGWLAQALLLSLVSLFKGRAPHFGLNLQIAIWAALPLGLMAGLQLLYYSAGGPIGADGISGLVSELPGYESLTPFAQALVTALASQITIFWFWNLLLLYFGGRYALDGGWLSSFLVVVLWMVLIILVPVIVQYSSAA